MFESILNVGYMLDIFIEQYHESFGPAAELPARENQ
jgi:hypothetical protein